MKMALILLNNFHCEHIFMAEINRPNKQCEKLRKVFFMIYSEIYMDQHTRFLVLIASTSSKNLRRNCARLSSTATARSLASLLLYDDNTLYRPYDL